MGSVVLDGKALPKQIEASLAERVAKPKEKTGGRTPILTG